MIRNLFRHLQSAIRTSAAHAKSIPKSRSRQREPVSFPRSPTPGTPHVLKLKRGHQYECHPHNIERDKSRRPPVRGINEEVVDYCADGPDQHRKHEPPAQPSHSLEFFSVGIIHHDSAKVVQPGARSIQSSLPLILRVVSTTSHFASIPPKRCHFRFRESAFSASRTHLRDDGLHRSPDIGPAGRVPSPFVAPASCRLF